MKLAVVISLLVTVAIQKIRCDPGDENSTSSRCADECSFDYDRVTCTHADCRTLPVDQISGASVELINASFNRITSLPALVFPRLTSLDLSGNAITGIGGETFEQCQSLRYLNLSTNVITSITGTTFGTGLRHLVELDLSGNRIATIGDFAFQFLPALKTLDVSRNRLERLQDNTFFSSKIEVLRLDGNALYAVESGYFQDLSELWHLSLRGNRLRSIEAESFMMSDNLQRLDLGDNELEELRDDIFRKASRLPFSRLQAIHLDNNRIRTIADRTFSAFPDLKYIFLDDNKLASIGDDSPFPRSLHVIGLRGNPALKQIRNGTFTGLGALQTVNMSGCYKLSTIEGGAFDRRASSVTVFDASHCSLLHLDPDLLNWSRVTDLRLAENRWDCDCTLTWTKDALPENVLKSMQCTTPHKLKGKSLLEIDTNDMSCDFYTRYQYSMSIALIILATIIFIFAVISLACRYRYVLFYPCCYRSRGAYRTLYRKAPDEEDFSDPAVSIQMDQSNSETKLLKHVEPAHV